MALVLSRKKNEVIDITVGGERVKVKIVEIRGDKVRLGFEAGPYVLIDRQEITALKEAQRAKHDGTG